MHEVTLHLDGLRTEGIHGVLDFEYQQAQPFLVDVEYVVAMPDLAGGNATHRADQLSSTVSYADVADLAIARIRGAHAQLIETLALDIASDVLALGVRKVTVRVHKPAAPIPHEFVDVSASVTLESEILKPKLHHYVIGLGSNLENSVRHLQEACIEISPWCDEVLGASRIYQSAPMLAPEQEAQPDYFNAVMEVRSTYSPLEMLKALQEIELSHGRTREVRWGARTLDLDIIASDFSSTDPELTLPHPRAAQRRFVLEPWLEINPAAELNGEPVAQLLSALADQRIKPTKVELIPGGIAALDQRISEYYLGTSTENGADDEVS